MDRNDIDDEMLMAFADGALGPGEAGRVERAVAEDPALAARLAIFVKTGEVLSAAAHTRPAGPVSAHLEARVRDLAAHAEAATRQEAKDVDLASRRRVPFWQVPLAAGLALAMGVGAGLLASRNDAPSAPGPVAGLSLDDGTIAGGLATALDRLPAGAREVLAGGAAVTPVTSFRIHDGTLCREFEYDRADGTRLTSVACDGPAGWELRLAVASWQAGPDYAPASAPETLDTYLMATGAGAPLSLAQEEEALADRRQR